MASVFEQPPPLFRRQPVPKSDAQASHALDPPNACRQLGTEQTGISRPVRDPTDGCQPQIDGSGRVMALLEVDPIAKNDGAVEGETWLRPVPGDELSNRVLVGLLAAGDVRLLSTAVLACSRSGRASTRLGDFFRRDLDFGIRRRPPLPSPTDWSNGPPCGVLLSVIERVRL